jgi:hypothetical protein
MSKHTILFLAANPNSTDRLALDREARSIQSELERSGARDSFEFCTRWTAEPLDLLRELRKLRPTIVHFCGHGSSGVTGEQWSSDPSRDVAPPHVHVDHHSSERDAVYFHGPDGRARPVSPEALAAAFGAAGKSIRVVVLNACYTKKLAEVLTEHVDCVIGTPGSVRDEVARSFAIALYGGLMEGESVKAACRQGKVAISLEALGGSDSPQLVVRAGFDPDSIFVAVGRR